MATTASSSALAISIFAAQDLYYNVRPNAAVGIFTCGFGHFDFLPSSDFHTACSQVDSISTNRIWDCRFVQFIRRPTSTKMILTNTRDHAELSCLSDVRGLPAAHASSPAIRRTTSWSGGRDAETTPQILLDHIYCYLRVGVVPGTPLFLCSPIYFLLFIPNKGIHRAVSGHFP